MLFMNAVSEFSSGQEFILYLFGPRPHWVNLYFNNGTVKCHSPLAVVSYRRACLCIDMLATGNHRFKV